MQNTHTFSPHKIIVLVVFICAAIMALLFVFHLREQQKKPALSPDTGILFPAPREIKPFELKTFHQQTFNQKNFYRHWTLLFFGFTHCSSICPTTLDMMNRAYTKLLPHYPQLQVVLISLDPERDTLESLASYTHSYNPQFIGATGNLQELRKLQSQFGVYSARDPSNNNYQLQHTASIMLINPQGKWAGLFNYGLTPDQFVQGVRDSIHAS